MRLIVISFQKKKINVFDSYPFGVKVNGKSGYIVCVSDSSHYVNR